jgi:N6-adenosine-specific RNA methylase IME4
MSHEILLTAVLANRNDRFDDQSLRSWIEAPRGRHSEKPDVVREMIERASPGPRLELFARKLVPG